jgi:hypothetical protein
MGDGELNCHVCYMLDFGLCRQYTKSTGEVRPVSCCLHAHTCICILTRWYMADSETLM